MTILLSIALDLGINKRNRLGFIIMILVYLGTMEYLVLFSNNYFEMTLSISIILLVIPIVMRNFGLERSSNIVFLISNEIIMSLLYYVILRGFGNSITALDFYGTDIPTIYVNSAFQVIEALIELSNSFMFFLMIFPEIVYFSYRSKNMYPIILSSLALGGPNIASEMTHSILPLPYDPIKEASILVSILSLFFSIYLTIQFFKRKISLDKYLIFIIIDLALSLSSIYYSLTLNEIPYGIITLISIYLSLSDIKIHIIHFPNVQFSLMLPQLLWGFSIAIWYDIFQFEYLIGILLALTYGLLQYFIIRLV